MSREPKRLADLREPVSDAASPSPSPEAAFLGAVIRGQRGARAPEEKMQELAGRLGPLLQKPSALPARSTPWLGLSIVAIGIVASGAWITRSSTTREPPLSVATTAIEPAPVQAVAPAQPAAVDAPPAISVDALPNANAPGQAAAVATVPKCDEVELVDRADTKLRSGDPSGALDVVREHERRCTNGTLVQERERIAIEALAKLHRVDATKARARVFEERFPTSPHLRRVRQVLERLEADSR